MSIEEQVNQNIAILFNLSVLGRSFYGIHYQWMRVLGQPHVFQALLAINAKLCELMNNGIIVYPQPELIFQSLKYSYGPAFIKCVILVQDPYHSGQAMGLCLSSMQPGPVPLSLHYVLKAIHSLENNPYNRRTANGDLTYLANEGVLLLNCALTVEAGQLVCY